MGPTFYCQVHTFGYIFKLYFNFILEDEILQEKVKSKSCLNFKIYIKRTINFTVVIKLCLNIVKKIKKN